MAVFMIFYDWICLLVLMKRWLVCWYIACAQVVENMLSRLGFHRGLLFKTDTSYLKFLNRLHDVEMQLSAKGLWDQIPHPWLNLFVPAASINCFDRLVLKQLKTWDFSGPILVYPLNKSK